MSWLRVCVISVCGILIPEAALAGEMIRIPAGEVSIGTAPIQSERLAKHFGVNPQLFAIQTNRRVHLNDFWIDKFEVTNREYRQFIDATGHRPPLHWKVHGYPATEAAHPVTGVDFEDAEAYAKWAGKRLPTEEEWEKAARGSDGRLWPWGDEWEPTRCRSAPIDGSAVRGAAPIGQYPGDRSPYGVMDMAGNLAEWVVAPLPPRWKTTAVIKGGSFASSAAYQFLCATRTAHPKNHGGIGYLGFRCVADVPPKPTDNAASPLPDWKEPKPPSAPDPARYAKGRLQIRPMYNPDPGRKLYANTMSSTFLTMGKKIPQTVKESVPWRLGVRVPYFPDDRFTIMFENYWYREMQVAEFSEDYTAARLHARDPDHVDVTISIRGERDYVDIRYDLKSLSDSVINPSVEMCFQSLGAPNFRDHDGQRTFIDTAKGFQRTCFLNRHVVDRLWCQDYTLNPQTGTSVIEPARQNDLIAIVSRDRNWVVAPTSFSGRAHRLFNNWEYSCLHCIPASQLPSGGAATFRQRVYFLKGNLETLRTRYARDLAAEGGR